MDMTATVTILALLALVWVTLRPLARLIDRAIDRDLPDPRWLDTRPHR